MWVENFEKMSTSTILSIRERMRRKGVAIMKWASSHNFHAISVHKLYPLPKWSDIFVLQKEENMTFYINIIIKQKSTIQCKCGFIEKWNAHGTKDTRHLHSRWKSVVNINYIHFVTTGILQMSNQNDKCWLRSEKSEERILFFC